MKRLPHLVLILHSTGPAFGQVEGHEWPIAFQDDSTFRSSAAYGVRRTPEAFLIGRDGRLRAVRIPTDRLRDAVGEALKEGRRSDVRAIRIGRGSSGAYNASEPVETGGVIPHNGQWLPA